MAQFYPNAKKFSILCLMPGHICKIKLFLSEKWGKQKRQKEKRFCLFCFPKAPDVSIYTDAEEVEPAVHPQWRPGCRRFLSCMVSIPSHLFNHFFASNITIRYQGIELQIPVIYISPFNSPPLDVSRLPPASRHG